VGEGDKEEMKRKILIGCVFSALILLSLPFMSTIQAREVELVEAASVMVDGMSSVSVRSDILSTDELVVLIQDGVTLSLQYSNFNPDVVSMCSEITAATSSMLGSPGTPVFCSLLALAIIALLLAIIAWTFNFTPGPPNMDYTRWLLTTHGDLIYLYEDQCGDWPPWGPSSSVSSEMNLNTIDTYLNNIETYYTDGGCSLCSSSSSRLLSSR